MSIENWLKTNCTQLEKVFEDYAIGRFYYGKRPNNRLPLSDHGLCGVVGNKLIRFPSPFVHKKVTVFSSDDPEGTPHFVGFDGVKVLDIVSGQFYSDHEIQLSGIGIMLAIAPQLFIKVSPELTVLYATANAISEQLSLTYDFNYPRG